MIKLDVRTAKEWSLLRRNRDTTCGPFLPSSGLSFPRFFFPLLQPVLGMSGQPAVRQQSIQGSRVTRDDGRIEPEAFRDSLRAEVGHTNVTSLSKAASRNNLPNWY